MISTLALASSDAGSTRFKRLQFGVVGVGLLVIAALGCSSAYDAWRSYRYAVAGTQREINNVASALAEQTVWSLQAVDLLLLDTARWYQSERSLMPSEDIDAALAARTAPVPQVRQVTIFDAAGDQLHRSRGFSIPNHNVADRSYFRIQRDDPRAGLFMSEPLTTRSEGRTAMILSRRLDDPAGRFAGIVVANVDLEDFDRFYAAVDAGPGTRIALLREDGTLLVQSPAAAGLVGRKFPVFAALPAGNDSRVRDPIDGRMDFIAVVPVRNTPLRLAVTRDVAVALQPWRDETLRVAVRTLLVVLVGAALLVLLVRQIRRVASGQQALRESEERYALAMEGANEGHWDWDVLADRLYLSPRMKVLGGRAPDPGFATATEWLRRMRIHSEDRPAFDAALRDHFSRRAARFECEFRVRHPDGEWHWLLARGRCSFAADGDPLRFVGSASDVTEQKRAQIEKERLESQLRQSQKLEAIGTLAGGIAHDFNNVLGAILGYGELAMQHATASPDLRRYLDNVMHAAERAKLLVERILGFSRSGLGDRVLFNVQAIVEETLDLLGASLPVGIALRVRLEAGDAGVDGDPTDLHQVTMNLCTNAVQAMARGGQLTVDLQRRRVDKPETLARGTLLAGEYVRLAIADQGAGIPACLLDRIFDPFFTTKSVGEGTGLGLSLVHGIVTDLAGAIEVTSAVGRGTLVEVWLPVAGEAPVVAPRTAEALPRGHGETVMIVDDERALVDLAEEVVAGLGYEPVGFASSLAALQAFTAAPGRFDAVLTDEMMPDLQGTELARQIRNLRPSMPILLMSGRASQPLVEQATAVGIAEVLRKPLHGREIAESLARVIGSA